MAVVNTAIGLQKGVLDNLAQNGTQPLAVVNTAIGLQKGVF